VLQMAGSPLTAGILLALFFGLSLCGLGWALRHTPKTGWLLAAPIISSVIYAAIGSAFGIYFYPRFVIAALPSLIVGISLCGHVLTDWSQKRRLIAYALLALYLIPTMRQRTLIMTRPHSTPRDAAQYVQQWISNHPGNKEPLVACYGLGREVMSLYTPKAIPVSKPDEIIAAREKAKAEGRSLLIIQGYSMFNRSLLPDGMKILDDRGQFVQLGAWPGLDPDFYFRVLQDQAVAR